MNRLLQSIFTDKWETAAIKVAALLFLALLEPFNIFSSPLPAVALPVPTDPVELPDSFPVNATAVSPTDVIVDSLRVTPEGVDIMPADTVAILPEKGNGIAYRTFTPDPTRAVWLAALCPGLGQIYNRRYWKLPIVVGAYMGLAYGTTWNNTMLQDYARAYNDISDSDPNTNGYMDIFPPNMSESQIDKEYWTSVFKTRKDYFRRNRDMCIIAMIGVYLVAIVDAYVDASLSQFDISPDLALRWSPAVIPDARTGLPGVGLQWALCF